MTGHPTNVSPLIFADRASISPTTSSIDPLCGPIRDPSLLGASLLFKIVDRQAQDEPFSHPSCMMPIDTPINAPESYR